MLIRARADVDLQACVDLLREVHLADRYPTRWPDDPPSWLSPSGPLTAFVAVEDNKIVGHIAATGVPIVANCVELARLFVSPEYRRHGAGAALVDAVVDYARQRRNGLVLEVVDDRSGTLTFYERQGWRFTGRSTADWRLADGSQPTLAHFEYPLH